LREAGLLERHIRRIIADDRIYQERIAQAMRQVKMPRPACTPSKDAATLGASIIAISIFLYRYKNTATKVTILFNPSI
jgi:hypothetical protein